MHGKEMAHKILDGNKKMRIPTPTPSSWGLSVVSEGKMDDELGQKA
jgi:hypothetical protein